MSSNVLCYLFSTIGDSVVRSLKTRLEYIRKLADTDSAIESGPNSNLGRRRAYEILACQQRINYDGICNVTYYSLLTSYTISIDKTKNKSNVKGPPLLVLDKYGIIVNSSGTNKFIVDRALYTRLRKDTVVNLCPYVPINHCDEVSCFSNILMHLPWPLAGELRLIPVGLSSIQYYVIVLDLNLFPEYVKCTLEKFQHSDVIRKNVGTVCSSISSGQCDGNDSDVEEITTMYNYMADSNETDINIVGTELTNNNGVLTDISTVSKT